MRDVLGLLGWIALPFLAAAIGAQVTDPAWYQTLNRPDWAPPSWVFGPVWTVLYALMGVAAWLVWRAHGVAQARLALTLFLAQLILNATWSWLFFGLRRADLAFAEIVLLWLLIAATTMTFHARHRLAAWLLVPYLAWVTYAAALNWSLWQRGA